MKKSNSFSDSQARTPLLSALQQLASQPDAAFYAPGHKRGQGIPKQLEDLLGKAVFQADLPELPELDNLFAPSGAIEAAQELAAEAFGAERTWFLINGSTCGIIAAILATCRPQDKIILPRNIHYSAIAGLILSGAIPIFVTPELDREGDFAYGVSQETVAKALAEHPDTKAVMLVYPTYQGACSDLAAIARITSDRQIPLLVDEAHGAHFNFHPDLPPPALACGADLTVQSIHKVLGAMTQASMLHVRGNRIDPRTITKALQLVQSTSPSYLLLASLDAARQQMALEGEELLAKTLQLAEEARNKIGQIPGLSLLEAPEPPRSTFMRLDRTRLTVNVSELGSSGFEVDEILHSRLGVTAELPTLKHLTFIITSGNAAADIEKLIKAFTTLKKSQKPPLPPPLPLPSPPALLPMSPRDAHFAAWEVKPIDRAIGCISAELICPYPPGIPLLMPGETISQEAIDYLQRVLDRGGIITGCSDSSLKTLKTIER